MSSPENSRPLHLTPAQVAERLHVKPGTLATWRVQGTGPAYIKVGRKVLYPLAELEAWESKQTRTNTAQEFRGQ